MASKRNSIPPVHRRASGRVSASAHCLCLRPVCVPSASVSRRHGGDSHYCLRPVCVALQHRRMGAACVTQKRLNNFPVCLSRLRCNATQTARDLAARSSMRFHDFKQRSPCAPHASNFAETSSYALCASEDRPVEGPWTDRKAGHLYSTIRG